MIANKGEPLQILIPTEFSVHVSVMKFIFTGIFGNLK